MTHQTVPQAQDIPKEIEKWELHNS